MILKWLNNLNFTWNKADCQKFSQFCKKTTFTLSYRSLGMQLSKSMLKRNLSTNTIMLELAMTISMILVWMITILHIRLMKSRTHWRMMWTRWTLMLKRYQSYQTVLLLIYCLINSQSVIFWFMVMKMVV